MIPRVNISIQFFFLIFAFASAFAFAFPSALMTMMKMKTLFYSSINSHFVHKPNLVLAQLPADKKKKKKPIPVTAYEIRNLFYDHVCATVKIHWLHLEWKWIVALEKSHWLIRSGFVHKIKADLKWGKNGTRLLPWWQREGKYI